MSDTIHPESHGHWDRAQISDLLHERDALRAENERLRILLARYGKHDYVCSSEHGRFPKRCDCWLSHDRGRDRALRRND